MISPTYLRKIFNTFCSGHKPPLVPVYRMMVKRKLLGLCKTAPRLIWVTLISLVVIVIVKEPVNLISMGRRTVIVSPADFSDSSTFLLENQQIGSMKGLIMLENFPTKKWIVIDGLNSKCSDVTPITQDLSWRVVIVMSKREGYIVGCSYPRCVVLTEENHKQMLSHLSLPKMMNGPTKMSGYLYAIQHEAHSILDMSCLDISSNMSQHFFQLDVKQTKDVLLYNTSILFNPFEHFGYNHYTSKTLLSMQHAQEYQDGSHQNVDTTYFNSDMYYLQSMNTTSIRQGVSQCHTACDKHTDISNTEEHLLGIPVSLGDSTLGVLDSGPTMFSRDTFLWLFIPEGLPANVQNVFRSLFIHGLRVATSTPITYHFITHNMAQCSYNCAHENELVLDELYVKQFIKWIKYASCRQNSEIFHCMLDVMSKVMNILDSAAHHRLTNVNRRSRSSLMAWLDDLAYIGLDELYFRNKVHNDMKEAPKAMKVKYELQRDVWKTLSKTEVKKLQKHVFKNMHDICTKLTGVHPPLSFSHWKTSVADDIMLVIVVNYEFLFSTIPYLEYLHRHFFKYITYCGPRVDVFRDFAKEHGITYITYMEGMPHGWEYMYECMAHAMKLGMPVKGYMHIGDDTLINTPKIIELPKDQIWLAAGYEKKDLYKTKSLPHWLHWARDYGRRAVINVFNELHNVSATESPTVLSNGEQITVSPQYRYFARRFLQTYDKNVGVQNAVHRAIDIYYMPSSLKNDFIMAADLFRRHGTFIEMAVPIIHLGLAPKKNIHYLKGAMLWREARETPWKSFDVKTMTFVHPFKSKMHLNQTEGRQFFCNTYLPHMFQNKDKQYT